MPDLSSPSTHPVTVSVETDPPGADAKASIGAACRTPCALALQASGDFTVSVSLNGYVPQNVPVKLLPPEDPRFAGEGAAHARVDPNPVFVALEKAPPPPPPARKRPRKPATVRAPASPSTDTAAAAAEPATTSQTPALSSSAPWPMPR